MTPINLEIKIETYSIGRVEVLSTDEGCKRHRNVTLVRLSEVFRDTYKEINFRRGRHISSIRGH